MDDTLHELSVLVLLILIDDDLVADLLLYFVHIHVLEGVDKSCGNDHLESLLVRD